MWNQFLNTVSPWLVKIVVVAFLAIIGYVAHKYGHYIKAWIGDTAEKRVLAACQSAARQVEQTAVKDYKNTNNWNTNTKDFVKQDAVNIATQQSKFWVGLAKKVIGSDLSKYIPGWIEDVVLGLNKSSTKPAN